jgi:hypothetical protein
MTSDVKFVERRRGRGPTVAATTALLALVGLLFGSTAITALWLILILSALFFVSYHLDLKRAQARRRAAA